MKTPFAPLFRSVIQLIRLFPRKPSRARKQAVRHDHSLTVVARMQARLGLLCVCFLVQLPTVICGIVSCERAVASYRPVSLRKQRRLSRHPG